MLAEASFFGLRRFVQLSKYIKLSHFSEKLHFWGLKTKPSSAKLYFQHVLSFLPRLSRCPALDRGPRYAWRRSAKAEGGERKGVRVGCERLLSAQQVIHARKLIGKGECLDDEAKSLRVSRRTFYRALATYGRQSSSVSLE